MKKSGITKKEMDEIFPDGKKLKESQKKIGAVLIRSFGATKCMTEIDSNYVKYCLYDCGKISLEKLLVCNRKMIELSEGLTMKDIIEQIKGENVKIETWYKRA